MKRTLLEASVGKVTITANGLESNLLLLFSVITTNNDDDFEKQYSKIRTLGVLINEVKNLNVFDDNSMSILIEAKVQRNSFTHALSDKYVASISDSGSMFQLIQEFIAIEQTIDKADRLVVKKLHSLATEGGVDVRDIKKQAKLAVNNWENA